MQFIHIGYINEVCQLMITDAKDIDQNILVYNQYRRTNIIMEILYFCLHCNLYTDIGYIKCKPMIADAKDIGFSVVSNLIGNICPLFLFESLVTQQLLHLSLSQ